MPQVKNTLKYRKFLTVLDNLLHMPLFILYNKLLSKIRAELNISESEEIKNKEKLFAHAGDCKFFIHPSEKEVFLELAEKTKGVNIDEAIRRAEKICQHRFDLLGSGDVNLGKKINWHQDFKSGHSWPLVHYKKIKVVNINTDADIKVPWELSRFQHITDLGKAYWYINQMLNSSYQTGGDKEKYAREFVNQIEDWIENNPVGLGVNWVCPMDVAIRACNWIWGYYFFSQAPIFTNEFKERFLAALYQHGRHIFRNLEWGRIRGNHYLSDLVGLIYLGLFFSGDREAKRWLRYGLKEIKREIKHQVNKDGTDYEGSIGYHRLVTELFTYPALLCKYNGIEFPKWYWERLKKMYEFIQSYIRPDGKSPQIGDADDGRLHRLGYEEMNDHRYLLPLASIIFNESFAIPANNPDNFIEDAFWLLGGSKVIAYQNIIRTIPVYSSQAFSHGGYYIMRNNNLYIIIGAGRIKPRSSGGHYHCDALSLELCYGNQPFILDPGSYIYSGDYKMRNLFRSSTYHNSVVIDGEEINEFDYYNLFKMNNNTKTKTLLWDMGKEYDIFEGCHIGYQRLNSPVTHIRSVILDKCHNFVLIRDILETKGRHKYELYFHLAPLSVLKEEEKKAIICRTDRNFFVIASEDPDEIDMSLFDGWISYSYGTKERAPVVKYQKECEGNTEFVTILFLSDRDELDWAKIKEVSEKTFKRFKPTKQ